MFTSCLILQLQPLKNENFRDKWNGSEIKSNFDG